MAGSRQIALEHLTFLDVPPVPYIQMAAEAGFDAVGLRVHPADPGQETPDLRAGKPGSRRAISALAETGMTVLDIEVLALYPHTTPEDYEWALEAGAELGARYVNVTGNDPDPSRFADTLATLAGVAATYSLTPAIEPMAWKELNDFAQAFQMAEAAGAAVQVDALHFYRLGNDPASLAAVSPNLMSYLQISDAPAIPSDPDLHALQAEGRTARLLPGEGQLTLNELLAVMPAGCPIAVEVPSLAARRELGDAAYARKAYASVVSLRAPTSTTL